MGNVTFYILKDDRNGHFNPEKFYFFKKMLNDRMILGRIMSDRTIYKKTRKSKLVASK